MSEADNIQLVQQTYAAFGQGDMQTVMNNLADTIVWESRYPSSIPFGGTYTGQEQVMQFFGSVGQTLEVQEFMPQQFLAQNDTVVVLGYEQVTAKPTGVAYRNDWVHVWKLQDGKAIHVQSSNDVAAAEAAFRA